jgi:hypothetical protein
MIFTADCTSTAAFLLSACLALLAGSCLTPPAARGIANPSDAPRATVAAAPSLGDFTRTSPELFAKLRLGWNLGNSLDAPGGETAWGNSRVTPELLATVAKEGFGLVRIPVTWAQHMAELVNVNETVGFIN